MDCIKHKNKWLNYFNFTFYFLLLAGCSSIPPKVKQESIDPNAFYLRKNNLVFLHIKPNQMRKVLSGLRGTIPIIAKKSIASIYIDYSSEEIRAKFFGEFPKNWINASLWGRPFEFENKSTLRESQFKSKTSPLYISFPSRSLAYISSKGFYSLQEENSLRESSSLEDLRLVSKSQEFALFIEIRNLEELLSNLEIEVPQGLRLPFNFIEVSLSLKENHETELKLIFGSNSNSIPPALAIRFALNYILSKYPENPLSSAWKSVLITQNPDNNTQVIATINLSEKELRDSVSIIYSGYLKEKKEKEEENKKIKQEKLKK